MEIHKLAAGIIEEKRGISSIWQTFAAAKLALVARISIRDAKVIISEMLVD